jgi:hypothetical protein
MGIDYENEVSWHGQLLNVDQDARLKLCRGLYKFTITRYMLLSFI